MIRRPPRSTLFPLHDALPISDFSAGFPTATKSKGNRASEKRRISDSDRKSTRLNSSHTVISYAVFCLKKKKIHRKSTRLKSSNTVISYSVLWWTQQIV